MSQEGSNVNSVIGRHRISREEAKSLRTFFKGKSYGKFVAMLEDRIGILSTDMLSPSKCSTMESIESTRGEARGIKFVVDLAETIVAYVDNDVPIDTTDDEEY